MNTPLLCPCVVERDHFAWPIILPSFSNLLSTQGFTLNVGFMPYSFWGSADYDASATDPRKVFANQSGAEPEAIAAVCKVSNEGRWCI